MDLKNLFSKISFDNKDKEQAKKSEAPSHWIKCSSCNALMFIKEIENQDNVCPKCGFHLRVGAKRRIEILADENSFVEFDANLKPNDPLKFVDKLSYKKRVEDGLAKTGRVSSVISGECTINSIPVQLVVFDFAFMGGSLGSVEGEKIVRAVNRAIEKREAVIIVSASGGARMQESTFSLMQMAKTSAAIKHHDNAGLLYISILTNPTTGGVAASFASLGDIIIAERDALIGFAGQRVIRETLREELPEGFQTAEFQLKKGHIDMVIERSQLKDVLTNLLTLHGKRTPL